MDGDGDGDEKEFIIHAFALYAIYCLHNDMRHTNTPNEVVLRIKWVE